MVDGSRIVVLAGLLAGCATMLSAVGGVDIMLTSQPMTPGHFVIDVGHAMPTAVSMDRFRASEAVYLRIGFGDTNFHRVEAVVTGPSAFSRSWNADARPDLFSITRQFTLAAANTLAPGRYVMNVMLDGHPTGEYPFTVE
jgi:hypothetical protein